MEASLPPDEAIELLVRKAALDNEVAMIFMILAFLGSLIVFAWFTCIKRLFDQPETDRSKAHSTFFQNKILKASDHASDGKHHLLLAATGSVATIKIPLIVSTLSKHPNLSIRLLLTKSAAEFLRAQSYEQPSLAEISKLPCVDGIYFDEDEWRKPWVRGDSILHIELRRWADLMVIAPLSANSLAKISHGMSDNLITSVVRAWDFSGLIDGARPGVPLPYSMQKSDDELAGLPEQFRRGGKKGIIVAPAMNTAMWQHPVTEKQNKVLEDEWGVSSGGWFEVLRPVEKQLACGDTGSGAMRKWEDIVAVTETRLRLSEPEKKS